MKYSTPARVALGLVASVVASRGAPVAIGNHSFEDVVQTESTINEGAFDTAVSPWTQEDATWNNTRVITLDTTNPNLKRGVITGVDGDQYVVMAGDGGFTLIQSLAATLVADADYEVTASFASAFTSPTSTVGNLVEGTVSLYADYGGANQVQVATVTAGWDDLNDHHTIFQDYSATGSVAGGDAAIGSALTVVLSGYSDRSIFSGGSGNSGILADNIRLSELMETTKIPVVSTSYDAGSGEFTVVFTSETGKTYSVYGGASLDDIASWPEVSTADIVGDGSDIPFSDTAGTNRMFYQVRED